MTVSATAVRTRLESRPTVPVAGTSAPSKLTRRFANPVFVVNEYATTSPTLRERVPFVGLPVIPFPMTTVSVAPFGVVGGGELGPEASEPHDDATIASSGTPTKRATSVWDHDMGLRLEMAQMIAPQHR